MEEVVGMALPEASRSLPTVIFLSGLGCIDQPKALVVNIVSINQYLYDQNGSAAEGRGGGGDIAREMWWQGQSVGTFLPSVIVTTWDIDQNI
jgi:hypothetical protein